MKRHLFAISAGAIGIALTGATAQAQWSGHHDPAYGSEYQYDYGHEYSDYDDPRAHGPRGRSGYYGPGWWVQDIGSASHELSERATHLAHVLRGIDGYSHLSEDAVHLAARAEQFHRTVEGRVTRDYVLSHFRGLQSDWHHLNEEFSRAHHVHHSNHVAEDFAALRHAYAQVVQTIRRDWSRGSAYGSYAPHPPAHTYRARPVYQYQQYERPYVRSERPYVRVKPEARIRVRARVY